MSLPLLRGHRMSDDLEIQSPGIIVGSLTPGIPSAISFAVINLDSTGQTLSTWIGLTGGDLDDEQISTPQSCTDSPYDTYAFPGLYFTIPLGTPSGDYNLIINVDDTTTGSTGAPVPVPVTVAGTSGTPVVVNVQNGSVTTNQSVSESKFVTGVTNPNGDSITAYGFYDAGGGSGHLTVNGIALSDNSWVDVTTANLNTVQYVGGSSAGADTLDVEVYDATTATWSASSSLTATTTALHVAPTVSASDVSVAENTSAAASSLPSTTVYPYDDIVYITDEIDGFWFQGLGHLNAVGHRR